MSYKIPFIIKWNLFLSVQSSADSHWILGEKGESDLKCGNLYQQEIMDNLSIKQASS